MATTARFSCRVTANGSGLRLTARLDDQVFFSGDPAGSHDLAVDVLDDDGEHELVFELTQKTRAHTRVDDLGQIIQDITVDIRDWAIDEIPLGHTVVEQTAYRHDHNGTGSITVDKFYGTMGCNGTVTMKFTTPIYLWLLENM